MTRTAHHPKILDSELASVSEWALGASLGGGKYFSIYHVCPNMILGWPEGLLSTFSVDAPLFPFVNNSVLLVTELQKYRDFFSQPPLQLESAM